MKDASRILTDRVRQFSREHALWTPGSRVVLGVSGGADSLCMLHILGSVAAEEGLQLTAAYLHHGMRDPGGDDDGAFVANQARLVGTDFETDRVDVPDRARRARVGVEQAGREARRQFLSRLAARINADAVATGHTASDHAETVLLHLFRGSGVRGLTGIQPRGYENRIRPILCLTRTETERYCSERGLQPRRDPSNEDLRFARNRIRHSILPVVRMELNGAVEEALVRVGASAAEAAEALQWMGEILVASAATAKPGVYLRAPLRDALSAATTAAIQQILARALGSSDAYGFHDVRRLSEALRTGGAVRLTGGGIAEVSGDFVRVPIYDSEDSAGAIGSGQSRTPGTRDAGGRNSMQIPGLTRTPGGGSIETVTLVGSESNSEPCAPSVTIRSGGSLWVRTPEPGDRMRPAGRGGSRKLSDLFAECRVPRWERPLWPVVEDEIGILWAPLVAIDERAVNGEGEPVRLIWRRA